MDHMVYHSAAVARGLHRPFLIVDLPFMSYPSRELALANAVRLMQEAGRAWSARKRQSADRGGRVPRQP